MSLSARRARDASIPRMWGGMGIVLMSFFIWCMHTPFVHADDLFGGGGEGRDGSSIENAWLIESCEHLQNIGNSADTLAMYFEIPDSVDEIDCTATNPEDADHEGSVWGDGGFDPVGTSTDSFEFTGNFNGNNKTIRGLYIGGESAEEGIGLFSVVGVGGQVYDVILENTTVSGTQSSIGGLVGQNKGALTNVHVRGGIISGNDSTAWVGGVVGFNEGTIASSSGNITVAARDDVGGFVGRHDAGTISASFSLGTVYGRGSGINSIGGFVGIMGGTGAIVDSYSRSAVLVTNEGSGIGGFVGETDGAGTLTNVYATGIVAGGNGSAGGFAGSIGSVTVTSSYWDTDTSTKTTSDAGVGTSTAHMKDQSTYDGWDFASVWAIDSVGIGTGGAFINNGYPYLRGVAQQDEDDIALPIVSMELEDDLATLRMSTTSVIFKGTLILLGSEDVTMRGFHWGTSTFYGETIEETGGPYTTGDYTGSAVSVVCDTTYYFRSFASSSAGLALGPDLTFTRSCPFQEVTGSLDGSATWGTDIYTGDSGLGAAAVHAGLIEDGQTAFILVEYLAGEDSYSGSTRNGVTTEDWAEYPESMQVSLAEPTPTSLSVISATTSATITWTTPYNASQKISFGPTASYGATTEEENVDDVAHEILLENLVACSLYHYRAISRDAHSGAATSSDSTFTTVGCTSSAAIATSTTSTITTAGGGTLDFATTTITIPASFTGTSSSATFQAHELNATTFFASVAEPTGVDRIGNYVVTLRALADATTTLSSFDQALTVTISYEAADVADFDTSTLRIYRYNGTTWNELSGCTVDTDARTVSCTTTQFSDFALFGTPNEESEEEENTGGSTRTYSSSLPKTPLITESPEVIHLLALIAELTAKLKALGGMTPVISTTTLPTRDLEMGMEGEDVRVLQTYLNTHGFLLATTGVGSRGQETTRFGILTKRALIAFQTAHGLPRTGYYGPMTRKAMTK